MNAAFVDSFFVLEYGNESLEGRVDVAVDVLLEGEGQQVHRVVVRGAESVHLLAELLRQVGEVDSTLLIDGPHRRA